jgi:L-threonylcarbamoyladenylate synthase
MFTKVSKSTDEQINLALKVLNNDGVILYPTSTVWGIGCLASSKLGVDKIRSIKKRKMNHSFIGLIDSEKSLSKYVSNIPKKAFDIIKETSLQKTIIYQNSKKIISNIANENNEVALRITNLPYLKKLISLLDSPLVSTSANLSGNKTPNHFSKIEKEILEKVDIILSIDVQSTNEPSTIIKINSKGEIKEIRK